MVTELILWCFSDFTLFDGFLEVWKGNDYEVNSDFSVILVFCKIDKGEVGVGGGFIQNKFCVSSMTILTQTRGVSGSMW